MTVRPVESIDAYLDQGTGPPVVLVHGSITDHRIWEPHPRNASASCSGRRSDAAVLRHLAVARRREELLDRYPRRGSHGLRPVASTLEPVTLVGWSYGAAVCLLTAVQQPELVQRLVLYEPGIATFVDAPADAQAAASDRLAITAPARAAQTRVTSRTPPGCSWTGSMTGPAPSTTFLATFNRSCSTTVGRFRCSSPGRSRP